MSVDHSLRTDRRSLCHLLFVTPADPLLPLRKLVADQIRRKRIAAGLSQEELGYRAGLHRTYISLVERGRKSPTVDSLGQIAVALGVEPAELLTPPDLDSPGAAGG
ncbi:MAG: helix-turn-helix transcriptional regulator [Acidobacteriota bacterium]